MRIAGCAIRNPQSAARNPSVPGVIPGERFVLVHDIRYDGDALLRGESSNAPGWIANRTETS
jgi:hypothetical protein